MSAIAVSTSAIRYKGIVCDRCGVEVTEKKVRRERLGHIKLVVPIVHIWYFKSLPKQDRLPARYFLKKMESIVYYERYVVVQGGAAEEMIRTKLNLKGKGRHNAATDHRRTSTWKSWMLCHVKIRCCPTMIRTSSSPRWVPKACKCCFPASISISFLMICVMLQLTKLLSNVSRKPLKRLSVVEAFREATAA
jgi:DNA-directed RNA polymerase beta' subunit